MQHAISPLAAWSWLAAAVIDLDTVKTLVERIPQETVDTLSDLLQRTRAAFQRWADAAMAWETVQKGLTPAAKALVEPERQYREALHSLGIASQSMKRAVEAHRDALSAARQTRALLEEARQEFRAAKEVVVALKGPYTEVLEPRRKELTEARDRLHDRETEAKKTQEDLAKVLRYGCAGKLEEEMVEAFAQRLPAPGRYLRALAGQLSRGLEPEEQQDIINRRLAGTPEAILAAEYRVSSRWIRQTLSAYRKGVGSAS